MTPIRSLPILAFALALALGGAARALPMTYSVDVEVLLDNGYGLAAGTYSGAGLATIDVPEAAVAGLSGAALLDLTVTLGGDTWTLADAVDTNFAGVLQDGAPVGLLYFGLNAQGHVLSLAFDPEQLAVADLTEPEANRFAVGTYALSSPSSAVPEPGGALLFAAGIAVVALRVRRS